MKASSFLLPVGLWSFQGLSQRTWPWGLWDPPGGVGPHIPGFARDSPSRVGLLCSVDMGWGRIRPVSCKEQRRFQQFVRTAWSLSDQGRLPQSSPVAQLVKKLPIQETQEMWVRSLGQDNTLEKEMATHSSILAWKIPWTEEPGWRQSHVVAKSGTQMSTHASHSLSLRRRSRETPECTAGGWLQKTLLPKEELLPGLPGVPSGCSQGVGGRLPL